MRGKLYKLSDCYCCNLRNDKKIEKGLKSSKEKYIKDGLIEYFGDEDVDHSQDPFMKSLYPNANKITSYWHDIMGYSVLVVDDKFEGELSSAYELLSYAYFTGANYKDREELELMFMEDLDSYDGRSGWWLP